MAGRNRGTWCCSTAGTNYGACMPATASATAVDRVLHFVDALARVTPAYDSLHAALVGCVSRRGSWPAVRSGRGVTHLVLLPLPRDRAVTGVYNLGGAGRHAAELPGSSRSGSNTSSGQVVATMERLFHRARLLRAGRGRSADGLEQPRIHARSPARGSRAQPSQRAAGDLPGGRCRCACRRSTRRTVLPAGDNVLRELGARIESQVRASDACGTPRQRRLCHPVARHDAEPGATAGRADPGGGARGAGARGAGHCVADHGVDRYRGHRRR